MRLLHRLLFKNNKRLWKQLDDNVGPFYKKCIYLWSGCSQIVTHLVPSPATNVYLNRNHVSSSSSHNALSVLAALSVFPPLPLQVTTHIPGGIKGLELPAALLNLLAVLSHRGGPLAASLCVRWPPKTKQKKRIQTDLLTIRLSDL